MANWKNKGFSSSFAFILGKTASPEHETQRVYSVPARRVISGLLIGTVGQVSSIIMRMGKMGNWGGYHF